MGRKCSVQGCLSDSDRVEDLGVTFHKVPMQMEIRLKWLNLCKIPEEKKVIKVIHVCSRHFLRADFCNFKGKKYILRQGVFPSVFPWDKSKLEAIKSEKHQNKNKLNTNTTDVKSEEKEQNQEPLNISENDIKSEEKEAPLPKDEGIKCEIKSEIETDSTCNSSGSIDFSIDNRIHALDFNNKWYSAKIMEVDEEENEVLIHFENDVNKYDEWICMDSPRLRPFGDQIVTESIEKTEVDELDSSVVSPKIDEIKVETVKYEIGERCLAYWSDKRKFPAIITKILEDDSYEVLFDDGYVKVVKWNRLVKGQPQNIQSSPLFDPIQSSKQERRDKKRKINVAELFGKGKRQKSENPGSPKVRNITAAVATTSETISSKEVDTSNLNDSVLDEKLDENEAGLPRWIDGHPVGVDSHLEFQDGLKKTVIVPDPFLPEGWTKHLFKRPQAMKKWDILIVSPEGKKLRSRADVCKYLEVTKLLPYDEKMFNFSMCKPRKKKVIPTIEPKKTEEKKEKKEKIIERPVEEIIEPVKEEDENLLKIPLVDDAYQCPIEGCGKNFRRENLAQMHVKHYHPEYSKFLDTTPNVADLAYARTVGDSLDKSPVHSRSFKSKTATPRVGQVDSPTTVAGLDRENQTQSPLPAVNKHNKDAEIIKLLNTKPYDAKNEEEPLPSGLPPSMYPDMKLKDLMKSVEAIPKREDIHLNVTRPTQGIKTLLPVVRKPEHDLTPSTSQEALNTSSGKMRKKRKRAAPLPQIQTEEIRVKEEEPMQASPTLGTMATSDQQQEVENTNMIMEGGQLIKIVRMKQEEIINCTCGFHEEDGLMIQCEVCLCWQHAYCNNIQTESEVPDKYVCYICQHPLRQRSSRKFYHDQDWLKQGSLPVASYHTKDDESLPKRFEMLKKSHDISGGFVELQEFVNTLKVKLKIAEAKNHPKLYLWSKPWEKLPLPEKLEETAKEEKKDTFNDEKLDNEEENQLNKDLKSMMECNQPQVPIIPQPEAAIETADCRLNLLDHILHSQELVMERLDSYEKQLEELEEGCGILEEDPDGSRAKQTFQMLMRDLNKLEELGQNTSI